MPNFNTRSPPEPSRASKILTSAVGVLRRLHTSAGSLWRSAIHNRWLSSAGEMVLVGIEDSGDFLLRNIARYRRATGVGILLLGLLAGGFIIYQMAFVPEPWPPEYRVDYTPE